MSASSIVSPTSETTASSAAEISEDTGPASAVTATCPPEVERKKSKASLSPLIKRETAHKVVSVDGIYNFRMQTMREGWRQLAGLVNNLVSVACDAGEIVKITAFIMSSTERPVNNLLVYSINGRPRIKNLTTHKEVSPVGLFADSESNLLLGIVRQGPVRINIQGKPLSDDVVKVLKGIATIKNSGV